MTIEARPDSLARYQELRNKRTELVKAAEVSPQFTGDILAKGIGNIDLQCRRIARDPLVQTWAGAVVAVLEDTQRKQAQAEAEFNQASQLLADTGIISKRELERRRREAIESIQPGLSPEDIELARELATKQKKVKKAPSAEKVAKQSGPSARSSRANDYLDRFVGEEIGPKPSVEIAFLPDNTVMTPDGTIHNPAVNPYKETPYDLTNLRLSALKVLIEKQGGMISGRELWDLVTSGADYDTRINYRIRQWLQQIIVDEKPVVMEFGGVGQEVRVGIVEFEVNREKDSAVQEPKSESVKVLEPAPVVSPPSADVQKKVIHIFKSDPVTQPVPKAEPTNVVTEVPTAKEEQKSQRVLDLEKKFGDEIRKAVIVINKAGMLSGGGVNQVLGALNLRRSDIAGARNKDMLTGSKSVGSFSFEDLIALSAYRKYSKLLSERPNQKIFFNLLEKMLPTLLIELGLS